MKLTKSDRIIKPLHVFLFFKCYFTLLTVLLFFEVICATCRSELLKITKYHTTTKIGSPKLNYIFFFILQHNVIVFILLQSTADIVHLAKVTTVFCGAYIPIIPIISATDFWRYVSLLLYSQWWSQCCSFSWKDVQFSAQDIVRSGLGDVGSCGDADRKSTMIYTQGSNSG